MKLTCHNNASEWTKISPNILRGEVSRSLNIWPTLATQKRLLSLLSKNRKKVTVVIASQKTSVSFILLCRLFEKVSSQSLNNILLQPISQLNLWKLVPLYYVWSWQSIRHRHPWIWLMTFFCSFCSLWCRICSSVSPSIYLKTTYQRCRCWMAILASILPR